MVSRFAWMETSSCGIGRRPLQVSGFFSAKPFGPDGSRLVVVEDLVVADEVAVGERPAKDMLAVVEVDGFGCNYSIGLLVRWRR